MFDSIARRGPLLAATAVLLASYFALTVSAILARSYIFAFLLVLSTAIDLVVERRFASVVAVLRRAQFGISHRAFVQVFLFLLLVAITDANREMTRLELLGITLLALAVPVVRIGYLGVLTLVTRRTTPPVETRNIPVPDVLRNTGLPPLLTTMPGTRLLLLGVPPLVVGAIGVARDFFAPFVVLVLLYVLVVSLAALYLLRKLVTGEGMPRRQEIIDAVSKEIRKIGPEVILYFSGTASSLYQVEMWYSTLARMPRKCLILVRGPHAERNLARTDLPILSIPKQTDLMNFPLPDARIALYVANVGNNIHYLREPRVKHVFIGHGDSDKVGSFNPFSKVYDEIWVAGKAGRDRYARARVGVRDEAIREVGRPQLDAIERRRPRPADAPPWPSEEEPLTVLYAPTWEGWTDDGFQTSVTEMSVDIVRGLMSSKLPLRVLYKPHPLIGTRDPKAAAADRRIRAMVASASKGSIPASVAAELDALTRRLASPSINDAEEERLRKEWNRLFWSANAGRHLVIDGKLPTLFDCFNAADLLITDVSSLISDWLASGKPFVVSNPKAMSDEEFRERFPSSRAAYLLHPGCEELPDILDAVIGDDPMSSVREAEKLYLLGPDDPPAQERWNAAVEDLIAIAEREWGGRHGTGPAVTSPDDDMLATEATEVEESGDQGLERPAADEQTAGEVATPSTEAVAGNETETASAVQNVPDREPSPGPGGTDPAEGTPVTEAGDATAVSDASDDRTSGTVAGSGADGEAGLRR